MEAKVKKCYTCGNFTAYYTKGNLQFNISDCGHCSEKQQICDKHETCGLWRSKGRANMYYFKHKSAKKALADILLQLSEIKQILKEEQQSE